MCTSDLSIQMHFFAIDHQTFYEFYYLFSLLRAPHSIMDKQESLFPHV